MTVRVEHGDSRDVLKTLADASIDSCCTDPPYSLASIQKRFGKPGSAPAQEGRDGLYRRASAGFMGKQWDTGETAFDPAFWAEVLRVLKPGAHLIAFSGTRTYHRMACAIEDAGFEIRDQIGWLYGAGFPKSHNTNKALHGRICCCEEEAKSSPECDLRSLRSADVPARVHPQDECGQVLHAGLSQPRPSPAVLRPESEEGGEGRGQCGMEGRGDLSQAARELRLGEVCAVPAGVHLDGEGGRLCDGAPSRYGEMDREAAASGRVRPPRGSQAAEQRAQQSRTVAGQPEPQAGGAWPLCDRCGKPIIPDGLGTALKPAWEPMCLARKPISGTVAENVLAHGTGALNIDGCRVGLESTRRTRTDADFGRINDDGWQPTPGVNGSEIGRWPANVIHDGSDEVIAAFPDRDGGGNINVSGGDERAVYGKSLHNVAKPAMGDSGSAARFFYSAKADDLDRFGSKHPTVKPIDLMAYLCRLITPPGGTVLDPFAGSGTTGAACLREWFNCILIEREAEYIADIKARLEAFDPYGRHPLVLKNRNQKTDDGQADGLFGWSAA